jgi:CubicO group peptidase (beta-lactamase class C family)
LVVGEGSDRMVLAARSPWPNRAEESNANAHLIAAAPDLLAACHALLAAEPLLGELCDGACKPGLNHHVSGCAVGLALAAIAKAEGKS